MVKVLTERRADVNLSAEGKTVLMLAAKAGHQKVVEHLVVARAMVDDQVHGGYSALMFAVQGGHHQVVRFLVLAGANKDLQEDRGQTASDLAREAKYPKISKYLG